MANSIYSKKLKSEADSFGVGINELLMADLIAIGYIKMDAFYLAFPDYQSKSPLEARNIMESISRGDGFKAIVKQRAEKHSGGDANFVQPDDGLIDKKQAAMEILRVAQSLPENSKERGEMFVKYSEMLRKNDDSVDVGNDHLQYYLPLTCPKCSLYQTFKENKRKKDLEERKKLEAELAAKKKEEGEEEFEDYE